MKDQRFANCIGSALHEDLFLINLSVLHIEKIAFYLTEFSENQQFDTFFKL